MPDEAQPFSRRHGYRREDAKEITVREEAPAEVVKRVITIAVMHMDHDRLRDLASALQTADEPWNPVVVRSRDSSATTLQRWFSEEWPWFRFYDFIEKVYAELKGADEALAAFLELKEGEVAEFEAPVFEENVNRYFRHAGVGWQLVNGKIRTRGSEAFESAVQSAAEELEEANRPTASREIHEALRDLSRRPVPDLTGAAHHAMNSLECVARDVCGDQTATLGQIVKRHPGLIPRPLDTAVEKAWGYASEMARHIREGREPDREEVELVVGLAASVATYLSRKTRTHQ